MSKDQLSGSPLDEALRLLEAGEHEACLNHIRDHWLANPGDAKAATILCRLFTEAGALELALSLEKLVEEPDAVSCDPNKLFEAGYHLIDHRQFELAAMLLKRCLTVEPDDPTLNYELGYALMSLGRYREAIPLFKRAAAKADDFDVRLNLAVCYVCTRDIGRARRMIDLMSELVEDDEQKHELAHRRLVIRRLEALSDKASLTARDWMYAQYGTVLVTQPGEGGIPGPHEPLWNDYTAIGRQLVALKGVLDGLGEHFEVVEFYSPLSRPLAQAFADIIGLPCQSYQGPERPDRALLVMAWAGDIVGPHQAFVQHKDNRSIFAYALSTQEPLPVTPDMVGCLAHACAMPWDEHWKIRTKPDGSLPLIEHVAADTACPQAIADRIVERARAAESDPDLIEAVQEAVAYYILRRDLLVVGNHDLIGRRPEFTAELPL